MDFHVNIIWKIVIPIVAVNATVIGFCIYLLIAGRDEIRHIFRNLRRK